MAVCLRLVHAYAHACMHTRACMHLSVCVGVHVRMCAVCCHDRMCEFAHTMQRQHPAAHPTPIAAAPHHVHGSTGLPT